MKTGDVSVERVASGMCVTAGHLNRRVKAITGVTTQQYVLRIRLERARAMLQECTSMSVADVASSCCFDDAASFSRAFRRVYGMTPSQVRRP